MVENWLVTALGLLFLFVLFFALVLVFYKESLNQFLIDCDELKSEWDELKKKIERL